jgi:hypothetical protein
LTQFIAESHDLDLRNTTDLDGAMILAHASAPALAHWQDRPDRSDLIGIAVIVRHGGSSRSSKHGYARRVSARDGMPESSGCQVLDGASPPPTAARVSRRG